MEPVIIKSIGGMLRVGYSGKALGNTSASFGSSAEGNFDKFISKFPGKTVYDMPGVGKDNIARAAMHLPHKTIEYLGVEPSKLHCYVGPSISRKSYRFEVARFEKKLDSSWDNYISHEADGIHINLLGYVLKELKTFASSLMQPLARSSIQSRMMPEGVVIRS